MIVQVQISIHRFVAIVFFDCYSRAFFLAVHCKTGLRTLIVVSSVVYLPRLLDAL